MTKITKSQAKKMFMDNMVYMDTDDGKKLVTGFKLKKIGNVLRQRTVILSDKEEVEIPKQQIHNFYIAG